MRKVFSAFLMLMAASFLLTSCGSPAANNANAPKNTSANNAATTAATATPSSANAEADVKKLVSDLAAALSKNDTAALDKIYADDYTLVTQTGEIATKAQRIEAIKSGDLKFENVAFNDVKVRSYGDSAVAIANTSGKSTNKGKVQETNFRVTFVANKTKDGWRMVSAHLSPMPEAAKTDDAKKDDADKDDDSDKPAANANK